MTNSNKKQYLVGLTGLIGSGKSVVAAHFANLGINIIDTDILAHEITSSNGVAIEQIKKTFGTTYLDKTNALDRKSMRELIFQDHGARLTLENILHPLILAKTHELIAVSQSPYTIIAVPLLFKSLQYMSLIGRSIFVDCPEELLVKRIKQRSSLSPEHIKAILKSQAPREIQVTLADDILNNNKSLNELYNNVLKLDIKYRNFYSNTL